jgi:hypothetical protein
MNALQRTSGAKLSLSAAVPRGLALLADALHGDLRRLSIPVTGPASPRRPGCSRYGTGGSMAQIKEIRKEFFPTMSGMTSAELKFAPPGDAGHLSHASK